MEIFLGIVQTSLIIALVMFILYGALKSKGKRICSLVLMLVSLGLTLFFTVAFIFDNLLPSGNITEFYGDLLYYVMIGNSVIYFVIFLILFIKNRGFIAAKTIKKKMVYTYHSKEEYLYVIYRYADKVYLLKDTCAGIRYKLRKMEFADDAIRTVNKSVDLNLDGEFDRTGMVTVKGDKADQVYYCYRIDLEQTLDNDMFIEVNLTELTNLSMMDFDRFVIYNCIMKNDFTEEF